MKVIEMQFTKLGVRATALRILAMAWPEVRGTNAYGYSFLRSRTLIVWDCWSRLYIVVVLLSSTWSMPLAISVLVLRLGARIDTERTSEAQISSQQL